MTKKLIVAVIFCISIFVSAQPAEQKIDELLSKYVDYHLFNGSVLVADESGVIFKKGYGYANMEWQIPNTPDTKFRLGSITKQFTAMLVLQLMEEGKIKPEDKITDYLDYYRKDTGDKVTIHHLLTHTSGIPSYTSNPDFFPEVSRKPYKPDDFVKEYCMGNFEFEPGEQFSYNNSGYFILGAIIEKITGKSYEDNLQERIFKPLDMKSSGFDVSEKIIDKRAAGYEKMGLSYVNSNFIDMSLPYAAGSLYSTVEDLYLWDRALYTNELLSSKYMDIYFKPYVAARNEHYAYGWFISKNKTWDEEKEKTIIAHGGGINGFNTQFARVIDDKKVVILLNNTGGTALNEMSTSIFNILYGIDYADPKIPISFHLAKKIEKDGIDPAVKEYKRISAGDKSLYDLSEEELNNLGYNYLRSGKLDEAAAVFYLNVEAYPEASNVYDSYGEVLMVKGEKEKAIENYKKSLELNPRNNNAVAQLKLMGVEVEKKKDITVSPEVLKTYNGKYQLQPDFIITITAEEEKLFAQATGQPKFEVFPESETKFYFKVVNAQIKFEKGENGAVKGLVLFQGGREMPANKIN